VVLPKKSSGFTQTEAEEFPAQQLINSSEFAMPSDLHYQANDITRNFLSHSNDYGIYREED